MLNELAALHPDVHTRRFWEACRRRELRIQRCADCGVFRHPPLPGYPACASPRDEWPLIEGAARVFSHTTVHHPAMPQVAGDVPYNVVVVEFEDAPGARIISNVLDAAHDVIEIGVALELVFDEVADDVVLPRFRLAKPASAS